MSIFQDQGTAAGPTYRPMLSQYKDQPQSMVPPNPGMNTMVCTVMWNFSLIYTNLF